MADLRPKEGGLGETKSSKEVVNYRHSEACKTCGHFSASGTCEIVAGNISPEAYCDKWEMMERGPKYRDKEYFQSEYDKQVK